MWQCEVYARNGVSDGAPTLSGIKTGTCHIHSLQESLKHLTKPIVSSQIICMFSTDA